MFIKFYRVADPGGGSGAGASADAASANQPGPAGTGSGGPGKTAPGAVVKPDGSGGGANPPQPKEPQTLEEWKALTKALEEKHAAERKEWDDYKKAKEQSYVSRIQRERTKALRLVTEDGEEIDLTGKLDKDGRLKADALLEINRKDREALMAELEAKQRIDAAEEHLYSVGNRHGLKDADVTAILKNVEAYADGTLDLKGQVELTEAIIRGRGAEKAIEAAYAQGKADAERLYAEKLGGQTPEGGPAPAGPAGPEGTKKPENLHPLAQDAYASMQRLTGRAS